MQRLTDKRENIPWWADPVGQPSNGYVNPISFLPRAKEADYPVALEALVEDAGEEVDVLYERRLENDANVAGVEQPNGEGPGVASELLVGQWDLYFPALQVYHQEEYEDG